MSIAFPLEGSTATLDRPRAPNGPDATRVASVARVAANRRNAGKSTGPRTAQGKRRSSGNAMKHGLCRTLACLPGECAATFGTFVAELEAELRPATALQRIAFNQIAGLTWRLERLPEAQVRIFAQELDKVRTTDGETLGPSDVLARRFSDAPAGNGFALLERYERGMRSGLLRLMRHYEQLKRHRPTTPYDPDEPPCPPEGSRPAWTNERAQAQRAWFDEQRRLHAAGEPVDPGWLRTHEFQEHQAGRPIPATTEDPAGAGQRRVLGRAETALFEQSPAAETAKRTQSNPSENADPEPPAGKCAIADASAVTKRTQCDTRAEVAKVGERNGTP